jgi:hypothetical protein
MAHGAVIGLGLECSTIPSGMTFGMIMEAVIIMGMKTSWVRASRLIKRLTCKRLQASILSRAAKAECDAPSAFVRCRSRRGGPSERTMADRPFRARQRIGRFHQSPITLRIAPYHRPDRAHGWTSRVDIVHPKNGCSCLHSGNDTRNRPRIPVFRIR